MEIDHVVLNQSNAPPDSDVRRQNQQYLLAAFAFFSFFNSPLSYSTSSYWDKRHGTHGHAHTGSVLGEPHHTLTPTTSGLIPGWRDVAQITHFAVSILLLFSIISPWLPRHTKFIPRHVRPLLGVSSPLTQPARKSPDGNQEDDGDKDDTRDSVSLLSALRMSGSIPPSLEAQMIREVLGLGTGVLGLALSLTRQMGSPGTKGSRVGLERRVLEQKAFSRLAELVALDGEHAYNLHVIRELC